MRKKLLSFIIILLVVVTVGLCLNRMLPKSFSKLVPEVRVNATSCLVNYIEWEDPVRLDDTAYQNFLAQLEKCNYYYDGKTDEIYPGTLFHIDFVSIDENALFQSIIVSDEGFLYIDGKSYRITSETVDIIGFLAGLYKSPSS